jgi:ribosomal protein L11 methyltransferase
MPLDARAWRLNRLTVLLDAGVDPKQLLAAVADALGIASPPIDGQRTVADEDWVRLTQSQFPPTRIGQRLWVVPSWHQPPDPAAINIRLDPGVAFGTGTHPTTRLCLAWLDQHLRPGVRVLDYGCGSGILAIAAARLGAAEVWGTDIDPQALESARANSRANGLAPEAARYTDPDSLPPPAAAAGRYDLVLANILANPLKLLAPALLARVAPGGTLVLAGILVRQTEDLIDTYARIDAGVPMQAWRAEDGWVCLAGTRGR